MTDFKNGDTGLAKAIAVDVAEGEIQMTQEHKDLHKAITTQSYLLSLSNKAKILAAIEEMLLDAQIDDDPDPDPAPVRTGAGTWIEERYVKGYGPYYYQYTRVAGRKKLVKYWGKRRP